MMPEDKAAQELMKLAFEIKEICSQIEGCSNCIFGTDVMLHDGYEEPQCLLNKDPYAWPVTSEVQRTYKLVPGDYNDLTKSSS